MRHRRWGFNCPGVDLDFVLVEYHLARPVAIVEYKHHLAEQADLQHPTYRAITALADQAHVPFFVARYWPAGWAFEVQPVNAEATAAVGHRVRYSERQFVELLHQLRGVVIHEQVLRHLSDELPALSSRSLATHEAS